MSAGFFSNDVVYTATYNDTQTHPIRLQPETLSATFNIGGTPTANTAPGDALTNPIAALTSLTRRSRGLRPRYVVVRWNTTKPTGYDGDFANVVIPNPALFDQIAFGMTGTYLGQEFTVIAKEPERAR